jgi:divalent metal cation (Fe/Co/Zn/Cd) transporter
MRTTPSERERVVRLGRRLQWATIAWNSVEVFVTVGLGLAAGSLALVAFGLDSLIEVFASLVVVWRLGPGGRVDEASRDRRALRLVAVAFGVLAAYLLAAGARQLAGGHEPGESPAGIAFLAVTAGVMFGLAAWKRRVGTVLVSPPFLAEASITFLDGCLAASILAALALNLTLGWWWADPVAAIVIGAVAAREGWAARRGGGGAG